MLRLTYTAFTVNLLGIKKCFNKVKNALASTKKNFLFMLKILYVFFIQGYLLGRNIAR
jgi:hypothetical protein